MSMRESSNEVCRATVRHSGRTRFARITGIAAALLTVAFTTTGAHAQSSVELVYSQPSAGGGISSGGDFSLVGSVAQVAAGPASGGNFDVVSGFIPGCEFACVQGDIDCSGSVDADDLAALLSSWGPCPGGIPCAADVNDDGLVNSNDLAILLGAWG